MLMQSEHKARQTNRRRRDPAFGFERPRCVSLPDWDGQYTGIYDQGKWEERRWKRRRVPEDAEGDGKVKDRKGNEEMGGKTRSVRGEGKGGLVTESGNATRLLFVLLFYTDRTKFSHSGNTNIKLDHRFKRLRGQTCKTQEVLEVAQVKQTACAAEAWVGTGPAYYRHVT